MTDRELAPVLPTDTEVELLAEEVAAARRYAEKSLALQLAPASIEERATERVQHR